MKKLSFPQRLYVNNLDYFAFINTFLFTLMTVFVYYKRFISFRGEANLYEFYFYATVIFLTITYSWLRFRHLEIHTYVLILIEITILIHFAGAFIQIDGSRLYDYRIMEIRYDKFVHLVNSLIGSTVVIYLFMKNGYAITKLMLTVTVLCVLGIGAIIEIIEFIVTLTVENNGVGNYVNNMSDLLANLIGSLLGISIYSKYKYEFKT
jgi:hypothetical protein